MPYVPGTHYLTLLRVVLVLYCFLFFISGYILKLAPLLLFMYSLSFGINYFTGNTPKMAILWHIFAYVTDRLYREALHATRLQLQTWNSTHNVFFTARSDWLVTLRDIYANAVKLPNQKSDHPSNREQRTTLQIDNFNLIEGRMEHFLASIVRFLKNSPLPSKTGTPHDLSPL